MDKTAANFQNPQKPNAFSARSKNLKSLPNLKFEREDWTSFRTIEGLQQKAEHIATRGLLISRLAQLAGEPRDCRFQTVN